METILGMKASDGTLVGEVKRPSSPYSQMDAQIPTLLHATVDKLFFVTEHFRQP